jgi:prepilin-type N-terminal cleavage/methylation domain-containing protein
MKRRSNRGVTLVELVIALAVIAIALISAVQVIVSSNTLKATTREMTIAREIAAGELEALKARAQVNGLSDVATYIAANPASTTNKLTQGTITRSVNTSNSRLYDVTITVVWGGGSGGNSLRYQTSAMIAK